MNHISHFVQSLGANAPKTARGQRTWSTLLEAAEKEFGQSGFHDAAITGITQAAGVALGTFYIYFSSKEEIFRALVAHMGHLTRSWIAQRVERAPDRISAEKQGMEAFIEFVREHKDLYRIVNEAQFVAPDAYEDYYRSFAKAYEENLDEAVKRDEIVEGNNEQRAWALIGINVFLGLRFGIWDQDQAAGDVILGAADLIERGLKR